MTNRLYYGDNLIVLREHIADDSIDLIYLDPPFNSSNYPPPCQGQPGVIHPVHESRGTRTAYEA